MIANAAHAPRSTRNCSDVEWKARTDLAAAYRLFDRLGMTDLIYTHMSARIPDTPDHFLINPYGLMFHEVTPDNLVKVDIDGNLVEEREGDQINPAGFTIHSAVHRARHDAGAVIHLHTDAGMAVSAQADGLLPITQHSLRWYNRIAYHDYEGIALDLAERERLVADLGTHHTMILRNHGLMTVGQDVPEAAILMYYLEQACRQQVMALSGGRPLITPPAEVCEHTARQYEHAYPRAGVLEWESLVRWLDGTTGPTGPR
ncbi:class II aldolase/adducin family protein [Azospirillum doebereinerae]|uniref:Class II aldolase/adducin family protein n=1 Tax=Azospirillum doebereinerae TaxID=92933 RepID=A0A3S0V0U1_9PROT|nr:class II aldolase/adducin family protein [Azospirillum doebereinerae]MCG5241222.1 class II aldolase/adducin family protein [Azospirillum doebereinerae]RUQ69769.1 class II aldolase/adducin family protein [Azospirillum doebereinerae]